MDEQCRKEAPLTLNQVLWRKRERLVPICVNMFSGDMRVTALYWSDKGNVHSLDFFFRIILLFMLPVMGYYQTYDTLRQYDTLWEHQHITGASGGGGGENPTETIRVFCLKVWNPKKNMKIDNLIPYSYLICEELQFDSSRRKIGPKEKFPAYWYEKPNCLIFLFLNY